MFFELVWRNSKRSRKENRIFFSSLLVSIVSFYIVLSLAHQDVMIFLRKMESDAVDKLLQMIPLLYALTLFLLFFLVYFAGKYQLECRSHEFGIYLIMGMKRSRLFLMLMAEDLWSSLLSLGMGLPIAILVSELTSLITARLVGIGILGHQIVFSINAIIWTILGFLGIKIFAFIILSSRISGMEIGKLLSPTPEHAKHQRSASIYIGCLLIGMLCLSVAYLFAIRGIAWTSLFVMGLTLIFGVLGTFLVFYGMRFIVGILASSPTKNKKLSVFTFRQLQEHIICKSNSLSISSLLILAALCCFGFGMATSCSYGKQEPHILDYTLQSWEEDLQVEEVIRKNHLEDKFDNLFEMKVGYIYTEERDTTFEMEHAKKILQQEPESTEKEVLLNNLSYTNSPHVISLSGYNQLLMLAGKTELELEPKQAAIYMDIEFASPKKIEMINRMLQQKPEVFIHCETDEWPYQSATEGIHSETTEWSSENPSEIAGEKYHLVGTLQTTNLVVDRSITLSFALILRDDEFEHLTNGRYSSYWDAVLKSELVEEQGLMQAITQVNEDLKQTELDYESYLQNMGRQLFYVVAASYITLYLAIIFLIIANTVLGVQFLMQQQNTSRRYCILIQLGSSYHALCSSAKRQIKWHFGLPLCIAIFSSFFGVWSLFIGLLPSSARSGTSKLLFVAIFMIVFLSVVEYGYLLAVTKASNRHILTLMKTEREE